ncbi:MAG: DUF1206 domain-containing protein [Ilumatobacteraceae bacterium]
MLLHVTVVSLTVCAIVAVFGRPPRMLASMQSSDTLPLGTRGRRSAASTTTTSGPTADRLGSGNGRDPDERGQRSERNDDGIDDAVADNVADVVNDHPWVEPLARIGWVAKGTVYVLMGFLGVAIARHTPQDDNASPEGALGMVAEQPLGRFLLVVATAGLVLYASWRLLTVALMRGSDATTWMERIGFTFSALFYLFLAFTAGRSAWLGTQPEDGNGVERLSRWALEQPAGRWLLGIAGVVTIGVGIYFAIHKALQRSFTEDLSGVRRASAPIRGRRSSSSGAV